MGCGASKNASVTVDTYGSGSGAKKPNNGPTHPPPQKTAQQTHQPASSTPYQQKPQETPLVKQHSQKKDQPAIHTSASPDPFVEDSSDNLQSITRNETVTIPRRTKTIAPTIAAFDDDGALLEDSKLAYQGGTGDETFVQETVDEEGEPEEPVQWVVLAPGELPPDVDISQIPKHYLPEEVERIQREEEERRKVEEEQERKAKMMRIYGSSKPDLMEDEGKSQAGQEQAGEKPAHAHDDVNGGDKEAQKHHGGETGHGNEVKESGHGNEETHVGEHGHGAEEKHVGEHGHGAEEKHVEEHSHGAEEEHGHKIAEKHGEEHVQDHKAAETHGPGNAHHEPDILTNVDQSHSHGHEAAHSEHAHVNSEHADTHVESSHNEGHGHAEATHAHGEEVKTEHAHEAAHEGETHEKSH
ncbi:hypothetical protein BC829DRAFT_449804 [Chytridium lagenaria]|nr:hypothetical protein BC829DRAFT_449804 [Chytridium lagenaria]